MKKNNKTKDDISELNLEEEFNIKDEDFKFLIDKNEKINNKILLHHLKSLDVSIEQIENGIFDMTYTIDEVIVKYEEGVIPREDCEKAIEKLFNIATFAEKISGDLKELKELKDSF